jgi:hypothetical protein
MTHGSIYRGARRCATCLLALLVLPAFAQEPVAPRATPAASEKRITGERLRHCKKLEEEMERLNARLISVNYAMNGHQRDIDRRSADLSTRRATLDRTNDIALEWFNRDVGMLNDSIRSHDVQLPEQNELVKRHAVRVRQFNAKCVDVTWDPNEWRKAKVEIDADLMPPETPH